MIATLSVTILIEGTIAAGYSAWRNKPLWPILASSIFANFVTQFALWIALNLFFHQYLITLYVAEFLIWITEAIILFSISANRLRLVNAILLSLSMNLSSFALGWFLPL